LAYLLALFVAPAERGAGIGTALTGHLHCEAAPDWPPSHHRRAAVTVNAGSLRGELGELPAAARNTD